MLRLRQGTQTVCRACYSSTSVHDAPSHATELLHHVHDFEVIAITVVSAFDAIGVCIVNAARAALCDSSTKSQLKKPQPRVGTPHFSVTDRRSDIYSYIPIP